MSTIKVSIKWGKEKYEDVEVDLSESAEVFMGQVFALTGVTPERQKIMYKGKVIKPDSNLQQLKLKDGAGLMLMGSVGEGLVAPAEATVFVEDMTQEERAGVSKLPQGLENFGNTCYMNATVQCLRTVPELEQAVIRYSENANSNTPEASTAAFLGRLYSTMQGKQDNSAACQAFLMMLRRQNPQFGEMRNGVPMQQDASECFSELFRALQSCQLDSGVSVVNAYFNIGQKVTLKCEEAPEEEPTVSNENQLQLSCHIDKDVGYMWAGIKAGMKETINKMSNTLNRDAVYNKMMEITRVPAYLVVNFVRFYFKRSTNMKCKITKDVKFSFSLDVFDLCTPEMKEKLRPARERFEWYNEYVIDKESSGEDVSAKKKKADSAAMDLDEVEEFEPYSFDDDLGSNNSGYYELQAVLTHRGRSSDSGHYVCWARLKGDDWVLFDDDTVTMRKKDEIEKLSGGADWHTAYILIYAPRRLPKITPEVQQRMDELRVAAAEKRAAAAAAAAAAESSNK